MYVREELDVFEGELENYIASVNQTGTLTPVILQVKELIKVAKGKTSLAHGCHLTGGGSPSPLIILQKWQLEVQ